MFTIENIDQSTKIHVKLSFFFPHLLFALHPESLLIIFEIQYLLTDLALKKSTCVSTGFFFAAYLTKYEYHTTDLGVSHGFTGFFISSFGSIGISAYRK